MPRFYSHKRHIKHKIPNLIPYPRSMPKIFVPSTFNLQPSTFNLQPSTFSLQPFLNSSFLIPNS